MCHIPAQGFAANELAVRIDDARPKAVVLASNGVEKGSALPYKPLVDSAIGLAEHKPGTVVVKQRVHAADGAPYPAGSANAKPKSLHPVMLLAGTTGPSTSGRDAPALRTNCTTAPPAEAPKL